MLTFLNISGKHSEILIILSSTKELIIINTSSLGCFF